MTGYGAKTAKIPLHPAAVLRPTEIKLKSILCGHNLGSQFAGKFSSTAAL